MFPRSLFMFLCLQMHSYPILGCFEHLRSQESPPILAVIPKIDDFLVLRLMRPLEAQTCGTNVIFLMSNRSHIKYMKNPWYIMGGADGGGAMYVMIYVKVKFLCQNRDNVFVVFSGEPV